MTYEAEALGGSGLDADLIGLAADDLGHHALHLRYMGIELGLLSTDGGIYVSKGETIGRNEIDGFLQYDLAVHVKRLVAGVRKVIAYVPHIGCSQHRIADGMDEYIGVAVAKQTEPTPIPSRGEGRFNYITIRAKLIERYFDAAKPEGATLYDAMDVVTKTDDPPPAPPKGKGGLISYITGFQCIRYVF